MIVNSTRFNQSTKTADSTLEPIEPLTEDTSLSTHEEAGTDPLATTLAAAVGGGVAGAALGRLVGGRVGSTIGAVVGGVAGVAIGHDGGKELSHKASGIVETIQDVPARAKAIAADITSDITSDQPIEDRQIEPDRVTLIEPSTEELTSQTQRFRYILPAKTHYHLGVALGRQGNLEAAIEEFTDALSLIRDSAETHYNLGIAFSKQGAWNQALEHMQQAKKLCIEQGKARGARMAQQAIRGMSFAVQ